MISPEQISERRFPGILPWIGTLAALSWAAGILSAFVGSQADGRLPPLAEFLVGRPLVAFVLAAVPVAVLARALKTSRPSVANAVFSWTALVLAPPIIDLILARFGIVAAPVNYLNAQQLLAAFLTAGFVPHPLASPGTLLVILAVAVGIWKSVLALNKDRRRALSAGVAASLLSTLVLAVPSMIGWFGLDRTQSVFSAGDSAVERGLTFLNLNGYWWKNVYERFPGTLGGEAQISVVMFVSAVAFLAVAVWLTWETLRRSGLTWRKLAPTFHGRQAVYYFVWLALGFCLALGQGAKFPISLVDAVAAGVLILTAALAWGASVLRRDLTDIAFDERYAPERPLIAGSLTPPAAREMMTLFWVLAFAGAWILGWPVLVSFAIFFLAREAYNSPPLRLKRKLPWNMLLLGMCAATWLLAGWFFGAQHAMAAKFPPGLLLGAILFGALFSSLKDLKHLSADQTSGMMTLPVFLGTSRARRGIGYALAAGYLLLPLMTGWFSWWFLAVPAAVGSYLLMMAPRYQENRIYLVFYAFALASVFWLAVLLPGS